MDENQINGMLQTTRDAVSLIKNKDVCIRLLQYTNSVFDQWALLNHYATRKVYCQCGRQLRTGEEITFLKSVGECIYCDHIRGEMLDYERSQYEE